MWSKRTPPNDYPVAGRILNRHKRAPKNRWWRVLKNRLFKLFIPAVLISLGFFVLLIIKAFGLI